MVDTNKRVTNDILGTFKLGDLQVLGKVLENAICNGILKAQKETLRNFPDTMEGLLTSCVPMIENFVKELDKVGDDK